MKIIQGVNTFTFDNSKLEYEFSYSPRIKYKKRSITGKLHKENYLTSTGKTIFDLDFTLNYFNITETEYNTLKLFTASELNSILLYNDDNTLIATCTGSLYFNKNNNLNFADTARIKLTARL
jgi:hypothetical protein